MFFAIHVHFAKIKTHFFFHKKTWVFHFESWLYTKWSISGPLRSSWILLAAEVRQPTLAPEASGSTIPGGSSCFFWLKINVPILRHGWNFMKPSIDLRYLYILRYLSSGCWESLLRNPQEMAFECCGGWFWQLIQAIKMVVLIRKDINFLKQPTPGPSTSNTSQDKYGSGWFRARHG